MDEITTITAGLESGSFETVVEESPQVDHPRPNRLWVWLGLTSILIVYLICIARLHPANFFGLTQDDSVYFSSAKALAQGSGYILPSIPGTPKATKYPILYPWLLSLVWRWNPSFPGNLTAALAITAGFGLIFLTVTFLFVRQIRGLGDIEALGITAFCALHPTVLFYSAQVLSEIPFSAMALGAMFLGHRAMQRDARPATSVGCGVLAGLSMLTRVMGIPMALGILIAALARKAWRQAALFAATSAPFFIWVAWRTLLLAPVAPPPGTASSGAGWTQTWLYYTSYLAFRKLGVTTHEALYALLSQFLYMVTNVPGYFLSTLFDHSMKLWLLSSLLVLWGILRRMLRQGRLFGWQPIHFALPFYSAIVLSWNYPEAKRFFIPFLPLFAACLWLEMKWTAKKLAGATRGSGFLVEKVIAAGLCLMMAGATAGMLWYFAFGERTQLSSLSHNRASLLAEKREAYDWIQHNAPESARVIAGEDVCVYLYTGRQAMSSIALRPAGAYEPALVREDLDHFTDVARAIGANYWMISPDDSEKQWKAAKPLLAERLGHMESVLPVLFQSQQGHVRAYGFP